METVTIVELNILPDAIPLVGGYRRPGDALAFGSKRSRAGTPPEMLPELRPWQVLVLDAAPGDPARQSSPQIARGGRVS